MTNSSLKFLLIAFLTKKPIILVLLPLLLLSFLIGWFYQGANLEMNIFISGGTNQPIQFLEGIILVVIAILSGLIIVIAIRRNLEKALKIFFSVGLILSSISVFWLHGYLIRIFFSDSVKVSTSLYHVLKWIEVVSAILGLIIGIMIFLVIILDKGNIILKNGAVFIMGVTIGTAFGLILHTATFFTLIILISLFDIYSVFKGSISEIFAETNLSISPQKHVNQVNLIAIGVGDFIFYSALVTFVSSNYSLILGICSIVGIITGIKITEKVLYRYGKFPGLPIPIFLSLFLLGMGWLIISNI